MIRFLAIAVILVAAPESINSDDYGPRIATASKPITIDSYTTEIGNLETDGNYTVNNTSGLENNNSLLQTDVGNEFSNTCDESRAITNCAGGTVNGSDKASVQEDHEDYNGTGGNAEANTTFSQSSTNNYDSKLFIRVDPTTLGKYEGNLLDERIRVSSPDPVTVDLPKSTLAISRKPLTKEGEKVSLERAGDTQLTTPAGAANFASIRNSAGERHESRRPRIHELLRLANNSLRNVSRPTALERPSFGTIRYSKSLDHPADKPKIFSTTTERNEEQFTILPFLSPNTLSEMTMTPAGTSATIILFNETRQNESINKFSQDIPWPVKKEAIVEGDIILGGLMMVHEREDSITCGPVMPQGGIQALEAMLFTLDQLNSAAEPLLPSITLGAHILDDCDKDTYGLEMAVDFIKGMLPTIAEFVTIK